MPASIRTDTHAAHALKQMGNDQKRRQERGIHSPGSATCSALFHSGLQTTLLWHARQC